MSKTNAIAHLSVQADELISAILEISEGLRRKEKSIPNALDIVRKLTVLSSQSAALATIMLDNEKRFELDKRLADMERKLGHD